MGVNRRPVQRMHKLQDDVRDNVPKERRIEKRDSTLNDSPGAHATVRGIQTRQDGNFGLDSLNRKLEAAWEADVDIERVDFGGADFGLRVNFVSSVKVLGRGFSAGDEFRVLETGSALASQRYEGIEASIAGDPAAGKAKMDPSNPVELRLPDDPTWVDELGVRVRVQHGAGKRS